jgi:hypothetical protein
MKPTTPAVAGGVLILVFLLGSADARSPAPAAAVVPEKVIDLDELAARSLAAVEEYEKAFRNLTAEETKVIEVFRPTGDIEKRREIVSDLLVYQSQSPRDGKTVATEYRDIRLVDGKAVKNRGERALTLLTKAARAESLDKELEAIDRETWRYEFRRHLRGFTISQAAVPKPSDKFHVEVAGREQIAGRDVIVVVYRQTRVSPAGTSNFPVPKELQAVPQLPRGRLWLDAETYQLRSSIWEIVVAATPEPYVLTHAESEYGPSRFGILVPERIVFEWRQPFARLKNGRPAFGMSERATFTYGAFKRFDVATEETLKK